MVVRPFVVIFRTLCGRKIVAILSPLAVFLFTEGRPSPASNVTHVTGCALVLFSRGIVETAVIPLVRNLSFNVGAIALSFFWQQFSREEGVFGRFLRFLSVVFIYYCKWPRSNANR